VSNKNVFQYIVVQGYKVARGVMKYAMVKEAVVLEIFFG
jgi:hypothetical protein